MENQRTTFREKQKFELTAHETELLAMCLNSVMVTVGKEYPHIEDLKLLKIRLERSLG